MHLTSKTRTLLAEKLLDLTNIGVGALIFGQFVSDKALSFPLIIAGIIILILGYTVSIVFAQQK